MFVFFVRRGQSRSPPAFHDGKPLSDSPLCNSFFIILQNARKYQIKYARSAKKQLTLCKNRYIIPATNGKEVI